MKLDLSYSEMQTMEVALTEMMAMLREVGDTGKSITEDELLATASPKRKEHYLNAKGIRYHIRAKGIRYHIRKNL